MVKPADKKVSFIYGTSLQTAVRCCKYYNGILWETAFGPGERFTRTERLLLLTGDFQVAVIH